MKQLEEVKYRDIKEWWHILETTHILMIRKFYPHFCGYEDDLKQEMMISLIKAIRRMKRGEIRSDQNYIITTLKYTAYKMGKKLITYDRATAYLEDLAITEGKSVFDQAMDWQDLFDMGCFSYETILSTFDSFEERYMVLVLIRRKGYTKRDLRERLKTTWDYINELEHRIKEKLREIIKLYTGDSNGS